MKLFYYVKRLITNYFISFYSNIIITLSYTIYSAPVQEAVKRILA